MKKLLALVAAVAACSVFAAYVPVTHTWKGGDETSPYEWNVAANWVDGFVPTNAADTCVFDLGAGVTNTITRTGLPAQSMCSLKLVSGTLKIPSDLSMPKTSKLGDGSVNPGNVTNVFDIAKGARLETTGACGVPTVIPYEGGRGCIKRGGGTWRHTGGFGSSSGNWNHGLFDVQEGWFSVSKTFYIQHVKVAAGATFECTADFNPIWYDSSAGSKVWVEVDGEFLMTYQNVQAMRGISGSGTVHFTSCNQSPGISIDLRDGPYRFGGIITFDYHNKKPNFTIKDLSGLAAAKKHFVVCGAQTLAGAADADWSLKADVAPEWGRGVTDFFTVPVQCAAGVPLTTENEDGEPITLHSGCKTDCEGTFAVTGSGNWFAWGNTTTITGDQIKVTGTIGSDKGATLVLGNGTDAEADVDLSQYAGLVPNGSVTFNNVTKQTVSSALDVGEKLTVKGPVDFASDVAAGGDVTADAAFFVGGDLTAGGKVSFNGATTINGDLTAAGAATFAGETTVKGDTKVGSLVVSAPTTLGHLESRGLSGMSADLTVQSGEIRGNVSIGGGTLTLENTKVFGGYGKTATYDTIYTALVPAGATVAGTKSTSRLVIGGGSEVRIGSSASALPSFTVKDGGRMTFLGSGGWAHNTAESALTVMLDGGTIGLLSWNDPYGYSFPKTPEKWTLKVGAKGGVFENTAAHSNGLGDHLRYHDSLTAESGVAEGKDGGLTYAIQASLNINAPKRITGPLVFKDGFVRFVLSAMLENNAITLGSIVLDGGVMGLKEGLAEDLKPLYAQADGADLTYRGAARLELGAYGGNNNFSVRPVPQTYTIGPAGATASALVRGGRGSVLRLTDRVNSQNPIGSANGNKVFVNGGVETRADGLVLAPVFGSRAYKMNFLKYDETNGFTEFGDDDYATALDAGADKIVKISGTATTLSSNATIAGLRLDYAENKPLTIAEDATLTVGDGVHPAAIILNTIYATSTASWTAINGAGAIDFGTSEGLLVKPERQHMSFDAPPVVSAAIHGRNGLTVVGDNLSQNPMLYLSGANDYAGGTFIDMIEVRASGDSPFGTGPVTVRGRRINGGAAAFGSAWTYTNDFAITGYGMNYNCHSSYHARGALHFRTSGTVLAGNVRVDEYARISATDAASNAVNTISGVISGGDLQFLNGAAEGKKIVLEGHNTLTGKVEILAADIVLKEANPSLGSGEVLVDAGVLEFENTEALVFANDMRGNGTIKLNGADVEFTGNTNVDGANALTVDLAGTAPVLKHFPPFATITNSAPKAATLTFDGGTPTIGADQTLAENVNIVLDGGAVLDLGGVDRTIRRLTIKDGSVVNGTITETKPAQGLLLLVR